MKPSIYFRIPSFIFVSADSEDLCFFCSTKSSQACPLNQRSNIKIAKFQPQDLQHRRAWTGMGNAKLVTSKTKQDIHVHTQVRNNDIQPYQIHVWMIVNPRPAASRHVCMMLCLMHGPLWFSSVLTSKCNCSKATTWPAQTYTIKITHAQSLVMSLPWPRLRSSYCSLCIYISPWCAMEKSHDYLKYILYTCLSKEVWMRNFRVTKF